MSKAIVYVKNCWLTERPYYGFPCLQGTMISGHPYITKDEEFWSSEIVSVDEENNVVETLNSFYNVESWRDNVQQGVVILGEPVTVGQDDTSQPEDVAAVEPVPSPAEVNTTPVEEPAPPTDV